MAAPLRLASIIAGPTYGGAHNQLLTLAGPLSERGIETIAVLPEDASEAAARIADGGNEVHMLPLTRPRASPDPRKIADFATSQRRDVIALRSLLRTVGADVVQVHGPTNPSGAIAASLDSRPLVWQLLDTRAPMPVRRAAMPMVTRLADVITAWGHALVAAYPGTDRLGERAIVVFPPVDRGRFEPTRSERRRPARTALGIAGSTPVVGSVGVLNPQKGHEDLIEAYRLLHRPAALRILGAPSPAHRAYEKRLRALAPQTGSSEDAAVIVDPGARVHELLPALDVFALASVARSEGMPTAILEAMVVGLPIVATDVGAAGELVENGRTGLLVPPGDPPALAAALDELLASRELRQSLAKAGQSRAAREFGLDELADRHAHAYRLALEHRRRRG